MTTITIQFTQDEYDGSTDVESVTYAWEDGSHTLDDRFMLDGVSPLSGGALARRLALAEDATFDLIYKLTSVFIRPLRSLS